MIVQQYFIAPCSPTDQDAEKIAKPNNRLIPTSEISAKSKERKITTTVIIND